MAKKEKTTGLTEKELRIRVAKTMYVDELKEQSEIASTLGVTQSNVSYWVNKFDWNKEKEIQFDIEDKAKQIKANMFRRMSKISENENYDLDEMTKAINDFAKFTERTNNKDVKLQVLIDLIRFVQTEIPETEAEKRNWILSNINAYSETL